MKYIIMLMLLFSTSVFAEPYVSKDRAKNDACYDKYEGKSIKQPCSDFNKKSMYVFSDNCAVNIFPTILICGNTSSDDNPRADCRDMGTRMDMLVDRDFIDDDGVGGYGSCETNAKITRQWVPIVTAYAVDNYEPGEYKINEGDFDNEANDCLSYAGDMLQYSRCKVSKNPESYKNAETMHLYCMFVDRNEPSCSLVIRKICDLSSSRDDKTDVVALYCKHYSETEIGSSPNISGQFGFYPCGWFDVNCNEKLDKSMTYKMESLLTVANQLSIENTDKIVREIQGVTSAILYHNQYIRDYAQLDINYTKTMIDELKKANGWLSEIEDNTSGGSGNSGGNSDGSEYIANSQMYISTSQQVLSDSMNSIMGEVGESSISKWVPDFFKFKYPEFLKGSSKCEAANFAFEIKLPNNKSLKSSANMTDMCKEYDSKIRKLIELFLYCITFVYVYYIYYNALRSK